MTLYEFGKTWQSLFLGKVDVLTLRDSEVSDMLEDAAENREVYVKLPLELMEKAELVALLDEVAAIGERRSDERKRNARPKD